MSAPLRLEASRDLGRDLNLVPSREPMGVPSRASSRVARREPSRELGRDTGIDRSREPSLELTREPSLELTREQSLEPTREQSLELTREQSLELSRTPRCELGRDTGYDRRPEPGRGLRLDPSRKSGREPSRDTGFNRSRDPGRELTLDSGREQGRKLAIDAGREPSRESSLDTSRESSLDTSRELPLDSGRELPLDAGREPSRESSLDTSRKLPLDSGREPSRELPPDSGRDSSPRHPVLRVRAVVLAFTLAVPSLFTACGNALPAPEILGIQPSSVEQGDAPQVMIELDAVLPYSVDYGAREAHVATEVLAQIGGVPLIGAALTPSGDLQAVVPLALGVGAHDVVITLADGRTATLPAGFTVTPGEFPDSFTIDPITTQRRDRPFDITIRAVGGQAAEFDGVVQLSVSRGAITPSQSGRFNAGVRVETVTLTAFDFDAVITVEDAAGHTGTSNAFRVFF